MELKNLKTKVIGRKILFTGEVTSTNDEARRLAETIKDEGAVVVADSQVKGRGRLGRRWISPPGGLYVSIVLKPYINPSKMTFVTQISSIAIVRTLRGLFKLDASVKWPNDIVISGKKAGGILCEASKKSIIAGIGINLNTNISMKDTTSVKFETGATADREKVLCILLEEFDKLYKDLLNNRQKDILLEWSAMCDTLGRHVKIATARAEVKGIAEKIGSRGELRVRGSDGKIRKVYPEDAIKVTVDKE